MFRQKRQLDVDFAEIIIDEIQKVPDLMETIKIRIDEAKIKSVNEETTVINILEQYKMPIETGLIIDTSDKVFPLNRNTYYCPVGMIGL